MLDDPARAHQGHLPAEPAREPDVVGDRQEEPPVPGDGQEEVGHPVAHRGVEALGGLVGHERRGARGGGGSEGHPLRHAAGKLMRVKGGGVRDAERLQGVRGGAGGRGAGASGDEAGGLGHLRGRAHGGVERAPGLLRQHREAPAPEGAARGRGEGVEPVGAVDRPVIRAPSAG